MTTPVFGGARSQGTGDLLLGVEGSGVKTQAVVADLGGTVLGRGLGPSSNQHRVGLDRACEALNIAIEAAVSQAPGGSSDGAWGDRIAAACLGLSGVDQPSDQTMISEWLKRQGVRSSCQVLNGSELILVGGTPEGWGVALISGTGSVCLGRTPDGRTARVGGWGPLLGDEGSGYQIALQALQVATQAADGRGEATPLLDAVLRYWRLNRAQQLIDFVHRPEVQTADLAEVALAVMELAGKGDPDAAKIVNHAGQALARHVDTVVRQLGIEGAPLALGGRNMMSGLRTAVTTHIGSRIGPVSVVPDPVQAAITIARRLLS
jgi:N-acetylglucosamine kinase-like BadF-type ATPase